jgi:ELKS/RAB6-interacting/CAST family protein 1
MIDFNEQNMISINSSTEINSTKSNKNFIQDLQLRLFNLQKENMYLKTELDSTRGKLSSSMQSIKQFWSPELKKERVKRKENESTIYTLNKQVSVLKADFQKLSDASESKSTDIMILNKKIESLQLEIKPFNGENIYEKNHERERDLLKNTISELNLIIESQKNTIYTKNETTAKLYDIIRTICNNSILKNSEILNNHVEKDIESCNVIFWIDGDKIFLHFN